MERIKIIYLIGILATTMVIVLIVGWFLHYKTTETGNPPQPKAQSTTSASPIAVFDLLGQYDTTGHALYTRGTANNNGGGPNSLGFNGPYGIALDAVNHRLFVADSRNNRVLIFPLDANDNLATATPSYVLGQPNFISRHAATTRNGMNYPHGVSYDPASQRLFVTDTGNSRILIFNVAPGTVTDGENASYVLGQPNFISIAANATQSRMNAPYNTSYDFVNHRLFIADDGNNRVLVFDVATSTIADGENASYVLGQQNFTSSRATTAKNGMNSPNGVSYDPAGQRLFVSDSSNQRILVFNVATSAIADGENASYVLGQQNFTSSAANTTRNGMNYPYDIFYDPIRQLLFSADSRNNRILVFNVATSAITDGENASYVLGQTDFVSRRAATTQDGMKDPYDVVSDPADQQLFVADAGNNRVLVLAYP